VAAAMLVPLLLLGGVELGLRLGGYGHPTSFFLPRRVNGVEMLVENTWFGLPFFPPGLARSPAAVAMPAKKLPGVYRIFLFGESAALGDPRPAYGMGRYLETLLSERHPEMRFEVISVAMTAINSHAVLPMARECSRYEGDLWLVYMGNNEFAGPFGSNTVFGPRALSAPAVRAYLAVQRLRLAQLVQGLTRSMGAQFAEPAAWGGLKMFLDNEVAPTDSRKERIYSNFEANLRAIIEAGQRAGVPVLVSSVTSNVKDCPPFASAGQRSGSGGGPDWQNKFESGLSQADQAHWPEALKLMKEAAQLAPEHAGIRFELGRCLTNQGDWSSAREQFIAARDLDALPFRADSKLNRLMQAAAERATNSRVLYIDAEKVLRGPGPDGLPGRESFLEHVHLTPKGNYRLARAFAEAIESYLPANEKGRVAEWPSPEVCTRRLGFTDWNRVSMLEEILQRLSDAPFTNQLRHTQRVQLITAEVQELKTRMKEGVAVADAREIHEDALRRRPTDPWLHYSYAEFLKSIGELAQATTQMEQVRQLLPHHHGAYLQLGRLLARQKKFGDARHAFNQAQGIRPDLAEIYVELGQIDAAEGHLDQALRMFERAQRYRPGDAATWVLKAKVYDEQKNTADAIRCLHEAVRLRPNHWETRYQLALRLSLDRQYSAAETELKAVVKSRPEFGPAHLHLGFALARQNKFEEALAEFRETLRLEPSNSQARQFLEQMEQLSGRAGQER
jgi:tetratricopeptide (TPR) repeat protein